MALVCLPVLQKGESQERGLVPSLGKGGAERDSVPVTSGGKMGVRRDQGAASAPLVCAHHGLSPGHAGGEAEGTRGGFGGAAAGAAMKPGHPHPWYARHEVSRGPCSFTSGLRASITSGSLGINPAQPMSHLCS